MRPWCLVMCISGGDEEGGMIDVEKARAELIAACEFRGASRRRAAMKSVWISRYGLPLCDEVERLRAEKEETGDRCAGMIGNIRDNLLDIGWPADAISALSADPDKGKTP